MATVFVTSIVNASVERVWEIMRDFNGLPVWHPFVETCRIEEDLPSATLGCVRNFQLTDGGATIREQLLALSDVDFSCTYNVLEAPMPVSNYIATFQLTRITTTNQTLGRWQASFDTPADEEQATVALVTNVFETGFRSVDELPNR